MYKLDQLTIADLNALRQIVSSQKLIVNQKLHGLNKLELDNKEANQNRLNQLFKDAEAVDAAIYDRCLAIGIQL